MGIKIDLTSQDLLILQTLLNHYLPNTLVWAFGSRVKFTAKPTSDLDLVAFINKDKEINFFDLKEALEESDLPFRVDLHNWYDLPETFHKNIENSFEVIQKDKNQVVPNNWKTYKLKDLAKIIVRGISPTYSEVGVPVINQKCVRDGQIKLNDIKFNNIEVKKVSDEKYLRINDILINSTGTGTLGRVGQVKNLNGLYTYDSHVTLVRIKEEHDSVFVGYGLKNLQPRIESLAEGSTGQTELNREKLKQLEIQIPDLSTQTQIAQILTSLDDKIELNLQMNQTLEAMAQAIFKEWFVNFNFPGFDGELVDGLPKGWEECTLGDFGRIVCGKTPSKAIDKYFGGEYMFIKIPDMHNSVFVISTNDTLTQEGLGSQLPKTIPTYSICISSIATVGLVCINPKPCQTNQQINTIVPKNNFLKFYLYFLALSMKETFIATASGGTATLNMNTSQFSNLSAIYPSENILLKFDNLLNPIMTKILENSYNNQTLKQTRDSLLPKLMSGSLIIS